MSNNEPIFSVLSGKSCTFSYITNQNSCSSNPAEAKCCITSCDGPDCVGECVSNYYGWQYYGFSSPEDCAQVFDPASCNWVACPAGSGYLNEGV